VNSRSEFHGDRYAFDCMVLFVEAGLNGFAGGRENVHRFETG